jgi:hypothetical protein
MYFVTDEVKKTTILVTLGYIPPPDLAKNLKLVHLFSAGVDWVYQSPLVRLTYPFPFSFSFYVQLISSQSPFLRSRTIT